MGLMMESVWETKTAHDELYTNFDNNGPWLRKPIVLSARAQTNMWVHALCALYCPQASYDGMHWYNVTREKLRGRSLECTSCGKKGATIKCLEKACPVNVHLPCAVKHEGWRLPIPSLKEANPFKCRAHTQQDINTAFSRPDVKNAAFDLSGGRERSCVSWVNARDENVLPSGFTYITESFYARTVPTAQGCTVTEAGEPSCAAQLGYYSTAGLLTEAALSLSPSEAVTECNFFSQCHASCRGRLVGGGLRIPLQVYRLPADSPTPGLVAGVPVSTGASLSTTVPMAAKHERYPTSNRGLEVDGWGVRVTQPVAKGRFICEIVGEIRHLTEEDEASMVMGRRACLERFHGHYTSPGAEVVAGVPAENLVLDYMKAGNVSRFIRRCGPGESPTLRKQVRSGFVGDVSACVVRGAWRMV